MIETGASKSFAGSAEVRCSDGALSPSHRVARGESAETSTERRGYTAPLLWLNLVCLDAPIVAVSWQWLFARTFDVPASTANSAALFLTAWLIYLADRFGDSVSVNPSALASLRQRFCLRYRSAWIAAIAVIAAADLFVICTRLDAHTLVVGAAVGICALLYLLMNQALPVLWRTLPVKEFSVGFLFAAGTMAPLWFGLTSDAWPAWFLFACLCSLNCVSIAVWERELDAAQGRISIATAFPVIGRWLLPALLLLALATLALVASGSTARGVHACILASGVLLAGVHVFRSKLRPDTRTALADLVLLAPLVALAPQAFS